MGDSLDLTGDGGVIKNILIKAKADAIHPSDSLPFVDGMNNFHVVSMLKRIKIMKLSSL